MAPTSLTAAKTDLYNLLATDANGTPKAAMFTAGVTKVYGYEPGHSDIVAGTPVTILSSRLGMTDFEFAVRVYQTLDQIHNGQDTLDAAVWATDAALSASSEYERSDWQIAFDQNVNALVAQTLVTCGRQDF